MLMSGDNTSGKTQLEKNDPNKTHYAYLGGTYYISLATLLAQNDGTIAGLKHKSNTTTNVVMVDGSARSLVARQLSGDTRDLPWGYSGGFTDYKLGINTVIISVNPKQILDKSLNFQRTNSYSTCIQTHCRTFFPFQKARCLSRKDSLRLKKFFQKRQ